MNTLINMSEYEKIIFVNGMNETQQNVNLTELSKDYPFVVFFTSNDSYSERLGYPIANIWKGLKINNQLIGTRLTRFIGVDDENNSINLGEGHVIKLIFDYNTGLLGLYDTNKLVAISFVSISYINLNDEFVNLSSNNVSSILINSIDNKFSLIFKFIAIGNAGDISNVLNLINNPNHFTLLSKNNKGLVQQELNDYTSIENEYNYKINIDTYKDNDLILYKFQSAFTSENLDSLCPNVNLSLILNPISFNVYHNEILLSSTITSIDNNSTALLDVNLSPSDVDSYIKRRLYVKLELSSNEYVKFANNESLLSQYSEVHNGHAYFNIKTENIYNITTSTLLKFSVYHNEDRYSLGYGQQYGNYLTETKTLILKGDDIDTFWYAGYNDPTSSNFDISQLLVFNSVNAGIDILYDWSDNNKNLNLSENPNKYFYIAIPYSYKDTILPRWDGYTINANNKKIYGDFRSGFIVYKESYIINNIRFIIYKSRFNGLLHGKIQ